MCVYCSINYEFISYGDFQVNQQVKELDLIFSVRYYTFLNWNIHLPRVDLPKAKFELAIGQPLMLFPVPISFILKHMPISYTCILNHTLIAVIANIIFLRPSMFVLRIRRMCWNFSGSIKAYKQTFLVTF